MFDPQHPLILFSSMLIFIFFSFLFSFVSGQDCLPHLLPSVRITASHPIRLSYSSQTSLPSARRGAALVPYISPHDSKLHALLHGGGGTYYFPGCGHDTQYLYFLGDLWDLNVECLVSLAGSAGGDLSSLDHTCWNLASGYAFSDCTVTPGPCDGGMCPATRAYHVGFLDLDDPSGAPIVFIHSGGRSTTRHYGLWGWDTVVESWRFYGNGPVCLRRHVTFFFQGKTYAFGGLVDNDVTPTISIRRFDIDHPGTSFSLVDLGLVTGCDAVLNSLYLFGGLWVDDDADEALWIFGGIRESSGLSTSQLVRVDLSAGSFGMCVHFGSPGGGSPSARGNSAFFSYQPFSFNKRHFFLAGSGANINTNGPNDLWALDVLPSPCFSEMSSSGTFRTVPETVGLSERAFGGMDPRSSELVFITFGGIDGDHDNDFVHSSLEIWIFLSCDGVLADDPSVCSGRGDCVEIDVCSCTDPLWEGPDCLTEVQCYDDFGDVGWRDWSDPRACSGHGACVGSDTCTCDGEHSGNACEIPWCNCNGFGIECIDVAGPAKPYCVCDEHHYGDACEFDFVCYGDAWNQPSACTNQNGECRDANDTCVCPAMQWTGLQCEIAICDGVPGNETATVCNGRGSCTLPDSCVCDKDPRWTGSLCTIEETCDGIQWPLEASCGGPDGFCIGHDDCNCTNSLLVGPFCQTKAECYGHVHDSPFACHAHGNCVGTDSCICQDSEYGGEDCSLVTCGGRASSHPDVCSQAGVCWALDLCYCRSRYYGRLCEEYLPDSVVSVSGHSSDPALTFSIPYYAAWSLVFAIKEQDGPFNCTQRVLADSSLLLGVDAVCEWITDEADQQIVVLQVIVETSRLASDSATLSLSLTLLSSANVFERADVSLVLQLEYPEEEVPGLAPTTVVGIVLPLVFVILLALGAVVGLACCVALYRLKMRKFDQLQDIDILLKEQEAAKDASVPHLNIKSEAFVIDWETIKLKKMIGQGGSEASVFLASYQDRDVAIKIFKTTMLGTSQQSFDEFESEVSILSTLLHPFILHFYGATLKQPRVGIVMEFCSNSELNLFLCGEHVKRGTAYPLKEKLRMLKEQASALVYIHSREIIHRDIKPQNVLVTKHEETRMCDFGLSKVISSHKNALHTQRVGTSCYMAPEVYLGDQYSASCDIFSFAMLMYTTLTELFEDPYCVEGASVESRVAFNPAFRPYTTENIPGLEGCRWLVPFITLGWDADPSVRPSATEFLSVISCNLGEVLDEGEVVGQSGSAAEDINHIPEKKQAEEEEEEIEVSLSRVQELMGLLDEKTTQVEWLHACLQQAYDLNAPSEEARRRARFLADSHKSTEN